LGLYLIAFYLLKDGCLPLADFVKKKPDSKINFC